MNINNSLNALINYEVSEHIKESEKILDFNYEINFLVAKIISCFENNNKILICGNGGSAADAQHLASEIVGRYESERKGYPAISLSTDCSAITAISNDYGFHNVFSRQIQSLGQEKDILIVLSTSGKSQNIINAIRSAKDLGIYTFGLLGKNGGDAISILDNNITINSERTCRIQEMHGLLIHLICQLIDHKLIRD